MGMLTYLGKIQEGRNCMSWLSNLEESIVTSSKNSREEGKLNPIFSFKRTVLVVEGSSKDST